MLSSSSRASDAGIRVKPLAWSVERWSAGSKRRRLSISSPKKSSRSAMRLAGREQVDQRAADRIFAMLGDGVGALVAERVQLLDQLIAVDPLAFRDPAGQLADPERRQQRAGSPRWRWRPAAAGLSRFAWSAFKRRQPLRHHPQRRRRAVVGQAVPRGQGQDLHLGSEQRARCRPARASPLRRRR